MTSALVSIFLAAVLAVPAPCPPKTTACAQGACVPLGQACPSAAEIDALANSAPVDEPVAETVATPVEEPPVLDAEDAPRPAKRLPPPPPPRALRSSECLESEADLGRRQTMRRIGFLVPAALALVTSASFLVGTYRYTQGVEKADAILAQVSQIDGMRYPSTLDSGYRGGLIAGAVVFGLLGLGLGIGGLVSAQNMERTRGACSLSGCALTLRF